MKQKSIAMYLVAGGLWWSGLAHLTAQTSTPPPGVTASTEAADRDATQKIRKSIMGDKTLSTYAHNVKILAHDGKVTLRGPVRSDAEKQTIAGMASAVVGADNVTNELTVQPSK